jgi:hypothetical protein
VVDHRPVALRHQAGQLPDAPAVEHDLEPVLTRVLSRGDRAGPQFDDRSPGASGQDVLVVLLACHGHGALGGKQDEVGRDAPVGGRRGEGHSALRCARDDLDVLDVAGGEALLPNVVRTIPNVVRTR